MLGGKKVVKEGCECWVEKVVKERCECWVKKRCVV